MFKKLWNGSKSPRGFIKDDIHDDNIHVMGNGYKAASLCVFACTVIPEKIKYENNKNK